MPEYRTPFPALLAGLLEGAVNRLLALDQASVARLARLEGKLLQVDIEGLGISLYFTFEFGAVQVSLRPDGEPDTVISGSPVALFALSAPERIQGWGLPGSGVGIRGDAALARDLGNLFTRLESDWETPLAGVLGDTLGFQLASGLRQGAGALREAARNTADMTAAYFRDESGALIGSRETEAFGAAVDDLRDGIGRLEARLERLRERRK